ncbi:MAG: hypothetical protein ACI865_002616 [Flavobacteriaceae bacterium]|jgi:hypothetical protein
MKKGRIKKVFKYFFIGLILIFGVIQFIRIDKANPKIEKAKDLISIYEPSVEIENILRTACYDCHSHETVYPWYSNIAPVSWWLKDHIDEGREHLNFSVWGDYSEQKANHKLHECAEEVEEGKMPLPSYLYTHGDAELTSDQQELLADWFESIMTNHGEGDEAHSHHEE